MWVIYAALRATPIVRRIPAIYSGNCPFIEAAGQNDLETVQAFLENSMGMDVNAVDFEGGTALYIGFWSGSSCYSSDTCLRTG